MSPLTNFSSKFINPIQSPHSYHLIQLVGCCYFFFFFTSFSLKAFPSFKVLILVKNYQYIIYRETQESIVFSLSSKSNLSMNLAHPTTYIQLDCFFFLSLLFLLQLLRIFPLDFMMVLRLFPQSSVFALPRQPVVSEVCLKVLADWKKSYDKP